MSDEFLKAYVNSIGGELKFDRDLNALPDEGIEPIIEFYYTPWCSFKKKLPFLNITNVNSLFDFKETGENPDKQSTNEFIYTNTCKLFALNLYYPIRDEETLDFKRSQYLDDYMTCTSNYYCDQSVLNSAKNRLADLFVRCGVDFVKHNWAKIRDDNYQSPSEEFITVRLTTIFLNTYYLSQSYRNNTFFQVCIDIAKRSSADHYTAKSGPVLKANSVKKTKDEFYHCRERVPNNDESIRTAYKLYKSKKLATLKDAAYYIESKTGVKYGESAVRKKFAKLVASKKSVTNVNSDTKKSVTNVNNKTKSTKKQK